MKMLFKIFVVIIFIGCNSKPKSRFEFLKGVSTTVNKMCPIQVDSIMKLENTLALPPSTFRYNFTLKYDTVKYDIREFEKSLRMTTLNMAKTNPDGKMFRDMNATLEYNFSDTLGNYLFRMVFKPEEYK
jgi:hypothetical protein